MILVSYAVLVTLAKAWTVISAVYMVAMGSRVGWRAWKRQAVSVWPDDQD